MDRSSPVVHDAAQISFAALFAIGFEPHHELAALPPAAAAPTALADDDRTLLANGAKQIRDALPAFARRDGFACWFRCSRRGLGLPLRTRWPARALPRWRLLRGQGHLGHGRRPTDSIDNLLHVGGDVSH